MIEMSNTAKITQFSLSFMFISSTSDICHFVFVNTAIYSDIMWQGEDDNSYLNFPETSHNWSSSVTCKYMWLTCMYVCDRSCMTHILSWGVVVEPLWLRQCWRLVEPFCRPPSVRETRHSKSVHVVALKLTAAVGPRSNIKGNSVRLWPIWQANLLRSVLGTLRSTDNLISPENYNVSSAQYHRM